jgi:hypothetical protein
MHKSSYAQPEYRAAAFDAGYQKQGLNIRDIKHLNTAHYKNVTKSQI